MLSRDHTLREPLREKYFRFCYYKCVCVCVCVSLLALELLSQEVLIAFSQWHVMKRGPRTQKHFLQTAHVTGTHGGQQTDRQTDISLSPKLSHKNSLIALRTPAATVPRQEVKSSDFLLRLCCTVCTGTNKQPGLKCDSARWSVEVFPALLCLTSWQKAAKPFDVKTNKTSPQCVRWLQWEGICSQAEN